MKKREVNLQAADDGRQDKQPSRGSPIPGAREWRDTEEYYSYVPAQW